MSVDARVDAWATLALKALPHRALFELLRALGDPVAVVKASRAQLQSIVPKATVDRLLHHAHICITQGESVRLAQATAGKGVVPLA